MASRHDSAMTPLGIIPAITTSGTAQQTTSIGDGHTAVFIRIAATQNTHYWPRSAQDTRVATTDAPLLPAGAVEYIQLQAGGSISVLSGGTAGVVTFTRVQ